MLGSNNVKSIYSLQTEKCGLGVVADEDIKQGDFVIEFVGEGNVMRYHLKYYCF